MTKNNIKSTIISVNGKWQWWAGDGEVIEQCNAISIIQSRDAYGPADTEEEALDGYRRMLEIDD